MTETTTVEQASESDLSWMDRPWEGFRCRCCQSLLLKITPDALKRGTALEVKCWKRGCKTMNYLMGT